MHEGRWGLCRIPTWVLALPFMIMGEPGGLQNPVTFQQLPCTILPLCVVVIYSLTRVLAVWPTSHLASVFSSAKRAEESHPSGWLEKQL